MCKCIEYDLSIKVKRRKYEIDNEEFVKYLRSFKHISNKEIARLLDVPITMVEHWFRTDEYQAIPPPQYWYQLKKILGIESNNYDIEITEFEEDTSKFEMRNRAYDEYGISPTIKSSGDVNVAIWEYGNRI